ncbi:MAG: fumarate hydratase [Spirochaetaceae bacterium]|jgi:fumarate hydratase subunit alpha|nr:fumarate hydratase [Spirochaetaceae bacterium]
MARILDTALVIPVIARLARQAACELPQDYVEALQEALEREESPYGKDVLQTLTENARYAKACQIPCCQDTGVCVVFMEIGQEISWTGIPLAEAVDEGVRRGYTEGYLRKSIVGDPLERINTGDNTPALLHIDIVPGADAAITVFPKGGGSENMGVYAALLPDAGEEGIRHFVLDAVKRAGGKPCPPVTLGIGLGGTMDYCCLLAKRALLRPHGSRNPLSRCAHLETELLTAVNALGIGPMGTGGRVTAMDVRIEQFACHITALPVAVCFQCHAARTARAVI